MEQNMERQGDFSALPVRKYGSQKRIDWKQTAGCRIPFVYGSISGELEILEYHPGNFITVRYGKQTRKMRTGRLLRLQIEALVDQARTCRSSKCLKSHETFVREVQEMYGGEYTVLSSYINSKTPVRIRHNSAACNWHEYFPTPNNFLRGAGCPACSGSPSFPEMCLLLVLHDFFPDARKQRIQGRECDIVFSAGGKKIGIQYDGAFFHQDPARDDTFNGLFLSEPQHALIRIREAGCPQLLPRERLYELSAPGNYSLENLQELLLRLFLLLNRMLGTDYRPEMTEKLMHQARRSSKKSFRYVMLLEEYIAYLHKHGDAPHRGEQNHLQDRLTTAVREQRFSEEELERLASVRRQYGLLEEERPFGQIYEDMLAFFERYGMLPRQQAGPPEETRLYREIQRCLKRKSFGRQQMEEYERIRGKASNYPVLAEELYERYIAFVEEKQRLPGMDAGDEEEKALAGRVSHRLQRGTFSPEQQEKIQELQRKYSHRRIRERIVEEYRVFIAENGRLPFYRTEGREGKLESNMLRYLRLHSFSPEECRQILKLRAPYQLLSRQLREHVDYLGGDACSFVQEQYETFCREQGRPPVRRRRCRREYDLCRLAEKYLGAELTARISEKYAEPEKSEQQKRMEEAAEKKKGQRRRTPDETFEEAMAFYAENGRFPLHVHKGKLPQRPYEGRLAARVTSLYRMGRFSARQLEILDQLRLKNADKAQMIYAAFLSYIESHDGQAPRHCAHTPENRLLNSLKSHMRSGKYTREQLDAILKYLPGRRREYPALDDLPGQKESCEQHVVPGVLPARSCGSAEGAV